MRSPPLLLQAGRTMTLGQGAGCAVAWQWPEADHLLTGHLALHQNSAAGHNLLGLSMLKENGPKEALEEFTRGAKLRCPSAENSPHVGLAYSLLNDYTDANRRNGAGR